MITKAYMIFIEFDYQFNETIELVEKKFNRIINYKKYRNKLDKNKLSYDGLFVHPTIELTVIGSEIVAEDLNYQLIKMLSSIEDVVIYQG